MRKIEQEMLSAIDKRVYFKKDNTEVRHSYSTIRVYLFDNLIANILDKVITLRDAGYQTYTTKSRLNAILSYYDRGFIYSYKKQWKYAYQGKIVDWTGELTIPMYLPPPDPTPLELEFVF